VLKLDESIVQEVSGGAESAMRRCLAMWFLPAASTASLHIRVFTVGVVMWTRHA